MNTPASSGSGGKICPGCTGRGTGPRCPICGGINPAHLLRAYQDSPPEWRWDCFGCLAATNHRHNDTGTAHVDDPAGDDW